MAALEDVKEVDFEARVFRRLEPAHVRELEAKGYAIVDGLFGKELCEALVGEIKGLRSADLLLPNQIKFLEKDGTSFTVTKPHIFELDLHHERRDHVPTLSQLFWSSHKLAARLNELSPMLQLKTTPGCHTLKVQCNDGHGGCFPWHYDNPAAPDKRRLSCLLYLNAEWTPGDGGEICLLPFLRPQATVAPLFDRLVLFYSETILHRVLPATRARHCLTIWLDSDVANDDAQAPVWPGLAGSDDPTTRALAKPSVQRRLSRGIYEEEYEQSIRECMHGDEAGLARLLQSHRTYVDALRRNPGLSGLIDALSVLKPSSSSSTVVT